MKLFKNIYNIIKELHPLYHKKHREWFDESYEICKKMLKRYDDEMSEIFVIQYFINKFQEEHTNIKLNIPDTYELRYCKIFGYFNGDILYITYSNDNRIDVGSTIKQINNQGIRDYINGFILYYGGIQNDIMDMKYQSNFIFIDHNNKYYEKPYNIILDNNKLIELKYTKINKKINILDYFTYDIIDQRYNIYKKEDKIYIHIHDFNQIEYKDLEKLLPCEEITVDLKYNFGGSINNVEKFFKLVYNIDIQLKINIKINKYSDDTDIINRMKKQLKEKNNDININKISGPKLNIYVNEYSKSASKIFIYIVKLIIPRYKIYGNINIEDICGTPITIITKEYELNIPTICYTLK